VKNNVKVCDYKINNISFKNKNSKWWMNTISNNNNNIII
jgi:hypothetical protein